MTTSRRHVAGIPGHGTVGTRRSVTYRNLGVEDAGDPRPTGSSRRASSSSGPLGDRRSGILVLRESAVHGSPALIAVEAEFATDLAHRGTRAFLPQRKSRPTGGDGCGHFLAEHLNRSRFTSECFLEPG